jgi:ribonuclease P protein component
MTPRGNTLGKSERLSGKKSISTLLADGRWGGLGHFRYCWLVQPAAAGASAGLGAGAPDVMPDQIGHLPTRILVSVPKRFFKRAVKRNLLKRRIREAYRQQKIDGVDVMFQYNSQEIADSATIFKEIGAILKRITDAQQTGTGAGVAAGSAAGTAAGVAAGFATETAAGTAAETNPANK